MARGWLIAQMVPGYCSGSKPQNHARALPRQIIATAQHYLRRHIRLPVSTTCPKKALHAYSRSSYRQPVSVSYQGKQGQKSCVDTVIYGSVSDKSMVLG